MPRISVTLPHEEHQALCDLALREWREVPDQAAYLIVDGLRRHAHTGELRAAGGAKPSAPRHATADADCEGRDGASAGQEVGHESIS